MPNDKDTLEAIKEALSKTPWNLTQHGKEMRTAPEWLRYLLQQNEQQQAEIERITKWQDEQRIKLWNLLQQSREETERLRGELEQVKVGVMNRIDSLLSRYTPKERGESQ